MINYLYSSQSNILTPLNTIYWLNALFVLSRLLFYKINLTNGIYGPSFQPQRVNKALLTVDLPALVWADRWLSMIKGNECPVTHMSANSSAWVCMLTKAWWTKPIISNTHRLNMRDRLMTRKADWPSPALSGSGSGVEWRGLRSHQCPAGSLYWETPTSQSRKTQVQNFWFMEMLIYGPDSLLLGEVLDGAERWQLLLQ